MNEIDDASARFYEERGCPCDLAIYVKDDDPRAKELINCEADCSDQCGKKQKGSFFLNEYLLIKLSIYQCTCCIDLSIC